MAGECVRIHHTKNLHTKKLKLLLRMSILLRWRKKSKRKSIKRLCAMHALKPSYARRRRRQRNDDAKKTSVENERKNRRRRRFWRTLKESA